MESNKTRRQILKYGTGLGTLATFTPQNVGAEEMSSADPPDNALLAGRTQSLATQTISPNNSASEVLIIRDCSSWDVDANATVLNELDTGFDVIGSNDIKSTELDQYQVVILPSTQSSNYYQNLADSSLELRTFVEDGGTLVGHVADSGYPCTTTWNETFLPGGVDHVTTYQDQLSISAESHPIYEGIDSGALDDWNYSTHGYLTDVPSNATILVSNELGDPTHIEYEFGSGRVVATMQTLEWPFLSGNGTRAVLRNELEYAVEERAVVRPVNTRLVQTVENTRLEESSGSTLADDEISTSNDGAPDTPDTDLVIGRGTAIVFDLEIEDLDAYSGDLEVTITRNNLKRPTEEDTFVIGEEDVVTAADDCLLEVIDSAFSSLDEEEIPVFDLTNLLQSVTVSLAPENGDIEGESTTLDFPQDVRDDVDDTLTPQLNVGFISVDNGEIEYGRIGENESSGSVQPRPFNAYSDFVEEAAEYMQRLFPTAKVNVYKQNYSDGIIGSLVNTTRPDGADPIFQKGFQTIDAQRARDELDDKLPVDSSDTPSEGTVFEVLDGSEDVVTGEDFTIDEFDVTIAVTPSEYFEYNEGNSSKIGVHYTGPALTADDPQAQPPKSAIVEYNNPRTVAHEAGHHFLNHPFDDNLEQDSGSEAHANADLVSTKYDLEDGSFEVSSEVPSFMSYGRPRWMDSYSKQILIDNDFDPLPEEGNTVEGIIRGISMAGEITSDGVTVQHIQSGNITAVTDVADGRGTVEVRNANGEVLSEYSIPTEFRFDAQERGEIGTVSNVFSASFPIEDEAVEVAIEAPDPDGAGTVMTQENLLTGPLRQDILFLPAEAFRADPQGIKTAIVNRIDTLAKHTEGGRFEPATNVAESIRKTLQKQLVDSYETEGAQQLPKEEILDRLDELIDQLEKRDERSGRGRSGNNGGRNGRGN